MDVPQGFTTALAALLIIACIAVYRAGKEPFRMENTGIPAAGKYAPFCNLNLTTKDLGFPAVSNLNRYWKTMPTAWRQMYSKKNFNQKLTHVHPQREGAKLEKTHVKSVDPNYYHDPGNYEKRFPGDSYYPDLTMPYQAAVDNVGTANQRTIEGLWYNGIKIHALLPV
jgi:hypothetical protein